MRILALDTTAGSCSVALAVDGVGVAETTLSGADAPSRQALAAAAALLRAAGWRTQDLEGLAVSVGPGTFTGLRSGLAMVKGLAAARRLPVAGVCSLEVLALQAGCFPGPICAALDARRGEVYLSRFRRHGEELRRESEARTADPHAAFTAAPESLSGDQTLFIGSGARRYRELIARSFGPAACFAPAWCDTLRAGVVAVLAEALFRRGAAEDAALIVPRYLRAADALPPRPAAIDKPRAI